MKNFLKSFFFHLNFSHKADFVIKKAFEANKNLMT